ncbi:MAG: hypothetical protein ACRELA_10750 [Candidatus Rokuibacteriota bacterium]
MNDESTGLHFQSFHRPGHPPPQNLRGADTQNLPKPRGRHRLPADAGSLQDEFAVVAPGLHMAPDGHPELEVENRVWEPGGGAAVTGPRESTAQRGASGDFEPPVLRSHDKWMKHEAAPFDVSR